MTYFQRRCLLPFIEVVLPSARRNGKGRGGGGGGGNCTAVFYEAFLFLLCGRCLCIDEVEEAYRIFGFELRYTSRQKSNIIRSSVFVPASYY